MNFMHRCAITALVAALANACRNADTVPADVREYHGDPSIQICGHRWSLDHESFLCSSEHLILSDLSRFKHLRHLRLSEATVDSRGAPPLLTISGLTISSSPIEPGVVAATFPNIDFLMISDCDFDFAALPPLHQLTSLNINRSTPPDPADIARHPLLRNVILSYLRCESCESELAAKVRALRPDIEIRTYSRNH